MTVEIVPTEPPDLEPLFGVDPEDVAAARHIVETVLQSKRAGNTTRTTRTSLDMLARVVLDGSGQQHLPQPRNEVLWHRLGVAQAGVLRARVLDRYAPATAKKLISTLRNVVRTAWSLRYIDADERDRVLEQLAQSVQGSRLPKGRFVPIGDVRAIFAAAAADLTPGGRRDAAIVALLMAGLRRSEVAGLTLAELDQGEWSLRFVGKNDKERKVHLSPGSVEALRAFLFERGDLPGPLLCRINRRNRARTSGGALKVGTSITGQTVELVLSGLCARAHVRDIDPHDLRRTLISTMLDDTDIATVAGIVGHKSVVTTQAYDRRPELAGKDAMARQHVPYVAPGGAS